MGKFTPAELGKSSPVLTKAKQTSIDLRKVHWPDVKNEDIWLLSNENKRSGFAQVPRTLAMVINIINDIAKRKYGKAMPAGKTYLALWLHHWGEGLVRSSSPTNPVIAWPPAIDQHLS